MICIKMFNYFLQLSLTNLSLSHQKSIYVVLGRILCLTIRQRSGAEVGSVPSSAPPKNVAVIPLFLL